VFDNKVIVQTEDGQAMNLVIMVAGIRKGRGGIRFTRHTKEEFDKNNQFWGAWKQ
jgi:hypothetical protein